MPFINLTQVGVEFPILDAGLRSLGRRLAGATRRRAVGGELRAEVGRPLAVQALAGVTLRLKDGDRVALLGHNGAGKSTMLRVMAGIYPPTSGRIERLGRVATLLDTSFGLDSDATGYENIRHHGILLGRSACEISTSIDSIAEFSELGEYLHLPLRTYSDGMRARLTFAMSTSVPADIILLDEWLSVSDRSFLDKAEHRMSQFVAASGILVLATQNLAIAERACSKAVLLDHGRVRQFAPVREVIATLVGAPATKPSPPEPDPDGVRRA